MACRTLVSSNLQSLLNSAAQKRLCYVPTTRGQAKALRCRKAKGDIVEPFKGMYLESDYWNSLRKREQEKHVIRTLFALHPTWVFSHASAAIIHNLDTQYSLYAPLHYEVSLTGGFCHSQRLISHRVKDLVCVKRDGANVTALEQTVVDCACLYEFKQALPIADSALHQGLTTKERLNSFLEGRPSRRGVRKAKRVIWHADHRADNGGESYVRALIIENKLPTPVLQAPIENPDKPGHYYYADFLFTKENGAKVVLELDGTEKYTSAEMLGDKGTVDAFMAERQREAAITAHGIQVLRLGFKQASNPDVLLPKLAQYGIEPTS